MTAQDVSRPCRILVVDDDEPLQRVLRMALADEGYVVHIAGDGIVGLEELEANDFDLVLLDLQMPRMDGREMYRQMRARGYTLPAIVLSAYGSQTASHELRAEAAVVKPFDIDTLLDTVASLLPSGT